MEASPNINVTVETIDPTTALKYLDMMPRNRHVSQTVVDRLARAMERGEWIVQANGPLRFDGDYNLIDGQHRLRALIATGLTLPFVVVRGVPRAGFYLFDVHRRRSLSDVLYIAGEVDTLTLSGVINLYGEYLASGRLQKTSRDSLSFAAALQILDEHPGLREALTHGHAIRRNFHGGPARWACLWHVLNDVDDADAEGFFAQLLTGEDLHQAHPILHLRRRLLEDAHALRKLPVLDYTALVFKGWNMWRTGKTTPRTITWKAGGKSPEAYPIPE